LSDINICNCRLAAVAERGGEHPQVHIFDLKMGRRKKTLSPEHETSSKEIISMSFSEDNQLLLTLTGAPDYVVMCWDWSKAKLLAFIANVTANPFHSCSFSPIDSSVAWYEIIVMTSTFD
jgi:cilia- and flagella-associated protein 57